MTIHLCFKVQVQSVTIVKIQLMSFFHWFHLKKENFHFISNTQGMFSYCLGEKWFKKFSIHVSNIFSRFSSQKFKELKIYFCQLYNFTYFSSFSKWNSNYSLILKNFNLLISYSTQTLQLWEETHIKTLCTFSSNYTPLQAFHVKNPLFNFMRPKLIQWLHDIFKCSENSIGKIFRTKFSGNEKHILEKLNWKYDQKIFQSNCYWP